MDLEHQITWLVMDNGLDMWGIWKHYDLWKLASDDVAHPITQVRKVPLTMHDGQTKYLKNVLHVPTIAKNLISIGQMVE